MQPTNLQVERSLVALEHQLAEVEGHAASTAGSTVSPDDLDLCTEMAAELGDEPVIRPERLQEARDRMAAGEQPTADDLADRMVGRLVCDRLR